jgi:hypothetical protein
MSVIAPEVRFEPVAEWIAQDPFSLRTDEGELKSLAVSLPHDAVEGSNQLRIQGGFLLHSSDSSAWIGFGDYNSNLDTRFTFLRENPDIALNSAELEFAARCEIIAGPADASRARVFLIVVRRPLE